MKISVLLLSLIAGATYSSVVPTKGERKLVDGGFLKRQKQVLDLYIGIADGEHFQNENSDFDIGGHKDLWTDPSVVEVFSKTYKQGLIQKDQIFSMNNLQTKKQTVQLFDIFFFAKDFDTFYKTACWAKKHVHPVQYAYTLTLAVIHRHDTQNLVLPPLYEILPTYFVPQNTLHKIYNMKMSGVKQGREEYDNTGYESNYHTNMLRGQVNHAENSPHLDTKISYFDEDIGMNNYYALWKLHYPSWMNPGKYQKTQWFKTGEQFYYSHEQLFARHSVERLANGLPYVEKLEWDQPLETGYNPRVQHSNGEALYTRPDHIIPQNVNKQHVQKVLTLENRVFGTIDKGILQVNETTVQINNEDGTDKLGKVIYGTSDSPTKGYHGSLYQTALDALGFVIKTRNDQSQNGGAITSSLTTLRDPVFYNYLNRLVGIFQRHKKTLQPYTQKDVGFPGVVVQNVNVDRLLTYFDRFDYEVTNAVPLKDLKDFSDHKYVVSQYRLNHKPFTYKITVTSNKPQDGIVRVFLGPKFDSGEHLLTQEQKRMLMVEIDHFPVKMTAGQNVFERNSKESPIFTEDPEGLKQLHSKISKALKTQEPYYINDKVTCGVPQRLQIPHGWKQGQHFTVSVVVSPFEKEYTRQKNKQFSTTCGPTSMLNDNRPFGYPFDRQVNEELNVPNILHQDVPVYHKGQFDIDSLEE